MSIMLYKKNPARLIAQHFTFKAGFLNMVSENSLLTVLGSEYTRSQIVHSVSSTKHDTLTAEISSSSSTISILSSDSSVDTATDRS